MGSAAQQGALRTAREAMRRCNYTAALEACRQAAASGEEMPLELLLVKAKALSELDRYKMCAAVYRHISSRYCNLLSELERQVSAQQSSCCGHDPSPTSIRCMGLHC